jgi:hypothetical protein
MTEILKNLCVPGRELDRRGYAIGGVVLMAVKYNLDRLVAGVLFDKPWSVFQYLNPPGHEAGLVGQPEDAKIFFLTMLALALPFIYVGVVSTTNRLRDVGLPRWLVTLFFVPVVNLLLFAALAILPTRLREQVEAADAGRGAILEKIVPRSMVGAAAVGMLLVLPPAALLILLGVNVLGAYGWGIFVGVPFAMGMGAASIYGFRADRRVWECVAVGMGAVTLLGLGLIALAIEGIICVAMAAPLALVLGAVGGLVGYFVQRSSVGPGSTQAMLMVLLLALPGIMGFERLEAVKPPLIPLKTSLEIDAPPEVVWRHVVSFSELPETDNWLFKAGVAYPKYAKIEGTGVGAVRHCVFSTGPFVEPITVWDEPRLLKFDVTLQPPAMEEMSPWGKIEAPHLDNYLVSEGGQFLLTRLPDGRTHLEGTTWYRHHIWPSAYWQVWSDAIIHSIHYRVLNHVKSLSEADVKKG